MATGQQSIRGRKRLHTIMCKPFYTSITNLYIHTKLVVNAIIIKVAFFQDQLNMYKGYFFFARSK